MNRKDFKVLLENWHKNFIISERAIPQAHNIELLGHDKSNSIVKKSRQLNGWITYFLDWKGGRDTSGSHIDYNEEGNLDVESHEDIDNKMRILSEEERNLVKAMFDLAPSMWNQICGLFKNEVVILNWKT